MSPLAGGAARGNPTPPSDPYVGTFSDGDIIVTLSRAAQGYTGTAAVQGRQGAPMGMNAPAAQNAQFVLNVMHWLTGLLGDGGE